MSQLKEHQKNALLLAKHKKIAHKIPDAGYQNPADIMYYRKANAFVVIISDKTAYFLDIDLINNCWQKSFTLENIKKLAEFKVELK